MFGLSARFDFSDVQDALNKARLVSYASMKKTMDRVGEILVDKMRGLATDPELSETKWGTGEESGALKRSIGYKTKIEGMEISLGVGMGLGAPIPLTEKKGEYPGGEEYWRLIDQGDEAGNVTRGEHHTPTPAGKPRYIYESQGQKIVTTKMGAQKGRHFIGRTQSWAESNPPEMQTEINKGVNEIASVINAPNRSQRQVEVQRIISLSSGSKFNREA